MCSLVFRWYVIFSEHRKQSWSPEKTGKKRKGKRKEKNESREGRRERQEEYRVGEKAEIKRKNTFSLECFSFF